MKGMEDTAQLTAVEVVRDYLLRLTFSDGVIRDIDLGDHVRGGIGYDNVRRPEYFALVRVDPSSDTIVWPDGTHFHGEELRELA